METDKGLVRVVQPIIISQWRQCACAVVSSQSTEQDKCFRRAAALKLLLRIFRDLVLSLRAEVQRVCLQGRRGRG